MRRRLLGVALAGVLGLSGLAVPQAASAAPLVGDIVRVSTSAGGLQADKGTRSDDPYYAVPPNWPALSADGTKVAFSSLATNLSTRDSDEGADVFVKDLTTGAITLASVQEGTGDAPVDYARDERTVGLSADGTKVVFDSRAQGLAGEPEDEEEIDVFVKDLTTGEVQLVSTGKAAGYRPTISADGTKVVYETPRSDGEPGAVVRVKDLVSQKTVTASTNAKGEAPNLPVFAPVLSGDGTKLAFSSAASNLIPGETAQVPGVFVKDLATGKVVRASAPSAQPERPYWLSLSDDGSKVAYVAHSTAGVRGTTSRNSDVYVSDLSAGTFVNASAAADGKRANANSYYLALSGDGSTVAFASAATDVVPGDRNATSDVFVRDLGTGVVSRASVPAGSGESDGRSIFPALSGDGSRVAFTSGASNLVAGDTNGVDDVFVRTVPADDRAEVSAVAGTLSTTVGRASLSSAGAQADAQSSGPPSVSANGRLVAFVSSATNLVPKDTNKVADVFVKDLTTGAVRRVSTTAKGAQLAKASSAPSISADGTRLAFVSAAPVVPGDTNGKADVFVKNLKTGALARVSVTKTGKQAKVGSARPALSGNGQVVAFVSWAKDATLSTHHDASPAVFVKDRRTGGLTALARNAELPAVSADGGTVAFVSDDPPKVAGYTTAAFDVLVRTLKTGKVVGVSKPYRGSKPRGDVFGRPSLSADGRVVAFGSSASNLVEGDTNDEVDVFVRNLDTGAITLASASTGGILSIGGGYDPVLSADGAKVAFLSDGPDLVANDDNFHVDVFVKTLKSGKVALASTSATGAQADRDCLTPALSGNGRKVAFLSPSAALVSGDTNKTSDVFVKAL